MFLGTTPNIVAQYLLKQLKEQNPARVIVPFAGNFVMEKIANQLDKKVYSSDVNLYSRAIGFFLSEQPFNLKLIKEVKDDFPMLKTDTPLEVATTILFLSEVSQLKAKSDREYYKKLYNNAVEHQEEYIEKCRNKLIKFKKDIKGITFYGQDALKLIDTAKENDFFFLDPPTIKGGYEKMFEDLEKCFIEPPQVRYTEIDAHKKNEILEVLDNKGASVYYSSTSEQKVPDNYKLIYYYKYSRNNAYHLYSNVESEKFIGYKESLKEVAKNYRVINEKDRITHKSKIKIVKTTGQITNHYRLLWVKKADMADQGTAYLITVDEKIIGVLRLQSAQTFGHDKCLIVTDPAPPYSNYQRLSKLVLYLITTQETLDMFNDETLWEHKGFTTIIFSNNPSSQKYRGLYEVVKKEETDGDYNKLTYHNKRLFKTWKEALSVWLQKESKYEVKWQ